jgi:hypothetical protein
MSHSSVYMYVHIGACDTVHHTISRYVILNRCESNQTDQGQSRGVNMYIVCIIACTYSPKHNPSIRKNQSTHTHPLDKLDKYTNTPAGCPADTVTSYIDRPGGDH